MNKPNPPGKDMFGNELNVYDKIVYLTHEHGYHLLNYGVIHKIVWFTPPWRAEGKIPKYHVRKERVVNGDDFHNKGLPRMVYLTRPNLIKRGVVI